MVAPGRNKPAPANSRPARRQLQLIRRNSSVGLVPAWISVPRCFFLPWPSKLGGENKVDAEDLDFYPGCPTIILFFPELKVGVREGERSYANGRINRETSFSSPKKGSLERYRH